jgi:hypothetical protein
LQICQSIHISRYRLYFRDFTSRYEHTAGEIARSLDHFYTFKTAQDLNIVSIMAMSQLIAKSAAAVGRLLMPRTSREMSNIALELRDTYAPSNVQRKILVWGRIFKTVEDVPTRVSCVQMNKAYDMFAVKVYAVVIAGWVLAMATAISDSRHKRLVRISNARGNERFATMAGTATTA